MSNETKNIFELGTSTTVSKVDEKVAGIKKKNEFSQAIFDADVKAEEDKIFDSMSSIYNRAKEALTSLKEEHSNKVKSGKKINSRIEGTEELIGRTDYTDQQLSEIKKLSDNHTSLRKLFDTAIEKSTWTAFVDLDNFLKKIKK